MATPLPPNRAPFTLDEILVATGGEATSRRAESAEGVSTDSRTASAGNVFVALVGGQRDGHQFLADVAGRGASVLLVSRGRSGTAPRSSGASVVEVDDTTRALGALALAHRRRWAQGGTGPKTVIGITGSAGKTTTRQATAVLLSGLGRSVHASAGNLNNAIGVPLVLLGLLAEHDTAVIEIGTSNPGEIAYGASVAEPAVGVLTLVSSAHAEGLGSVEDIAVEKGALFASLPGGGVAIVNGDDPLASAQLGRCPGARKLRYGQVQGADVRLVERLPQGIAGARLRLSLGAEGRELELTTPLLGRAGAYATTAAVAVASALGLGPLTSQGVTRAFGPLADERVGRLTPHRLADGTLLIDDSYNANPASMRASLEAAAEIARADGRRLVAVLGEMRELGAASRDEHRALGEAALRLGAAIVIAVSGDACELAASARSGQGAASFEPDAGRAESALLLAVRPGDVVLVKGSRGVGLERVARALLGR